MFERRRIINVLSEILDVGHRYLSFIWIVGVRSGW